MLCAQGVQNALAVVARMFVALPGVYPPRTQRYTIRHGGLAKSQVGNTGIHTQLHQRTRTRGSHQPRCKRNMPRPRRWR